MEAHFTPQRDRAVQLLSPIHPPIAVDQEPDPIEDPDLDRPVRHPDGTFTRDLTGLENGFVGLCLAILLAAAACGGAG